MPQWNGVYETLEKFGLGMAPGSPVGTILAVGPCSLGDDNEVYYYAASDKQALRTELGFGDLVDRLLDYFQLGGQKAKAIVIPANKDVAGTVQDCQEDKEGTASGASGGSPTGAYQIIIEIVIGGDFGDAVFKYSLDNGESWSGLITTPASSGTAYTIPDTGCTITWTDGDPSDDSFVEGDEFTFDTTSPSCTLTSILAALNVGVNLKLPFEFGCVLTPTDSTTWTGLGTWADTQFNNHKFFRVLTEAPLPTFAEDAATYTGRLNGERVDFAHDRIAVCAGTYQISDITGKFFIRGISGLVAGLIAASPVQRSIGETEFCRLTPIKGPDPDVTLSDGNLQTLNQARYIVARQYEELTGYFVNDGNMMTDDASDYQTIERCRVMDQVCRVARAESLKHLHKYVDLVNGVADPKGLRHIEGEVQGKLDGIKEIFSSATFTIPDDQDILQNEAIMATTSVVPKVYGKAIAISFGLARQ